MLQEERVPLRSDFWRCGDGIVLCPSCNVCINRGMACVLQSVCFLGLLALSSLLFLLLLVLQLLFLLRLSSRPRSTLALRNFLHSHCCTSSLVLQVCWWPSSHSLSMVCTPLFTSNLMTCFECADSFHPAPRHCQLARPFTLKSKDSQRLHSRILCTCALLPRTRMVWLFHQVFDPFLHLLQRISYALVRSSFTRGKHLCRHDMPCSS